MFTTGSKGNCDVDMAKRRYDTVCDGVEKLTLTSMVGNPVLIRRRHAIIVIELPTDL